MRAKLLLFIKIQTVKRQEQQLSDLLDAVPDSVFICSKNIFDSDGISKGPKCVYANFKMNSFFG